MSTLKEQYLALIHHRLDALVPLYDTPQKELFEAARYSLLGPGKRLRPLLVLSVLQGYHIPAHLGLDAACAIECVHTYSFIHDDLPCMDNDDLRRGRSTLHKVFPEGLAVLTGDFLLTYAFEILSHAPDLSSQQKLELIRSLAQRSGSHGMIGGQVVDIASEGHAMSWETLHFMHVHKTAALFISCLEFGAIIANLSEEDTKHLQRCAQAFGIAFQVIDDLHDHHDDLHFNPKYSKANTVSVLGRHKAEEIARKLLDEALKHTHMLSMPCSFLEELIKELFAYFPSLKQC